MARARAVRAAQRFARRTPYVLKLDIRRYYPSIDHDILKGLLRRGVSDGRLLALLDRIIDASNPQEGVLQWFPGDDLFAPVERRKGIPIGNLTSQFFGNVYLDPLDHHVTDQLGFGMWARWGRGTPATRRDAPPRAKPSAQWVGRSLQPHLLDGPGGEDSFEAAVRMRSKRTS